MARIPGILKNSRCVSYCCSWFSYMPDLALFVNCV